MRYFRFGLSKCQPLAPTSPCPEMRGTPDMGRRTLPGRDGVIRFQHRRKISSLLIRDTVVPIAIRTTSGSCLAIGRQITKNPELL